jgi:hypothetical protein
MEVMTGTEVFLGDLAERKAVVKELHDCSDLADHDLSSSVVKMELMKYVIARLTVATSLMNEFEGRCSEVEFYHSSNLGTLCFRMEAMLESNDVADEAHVHAAFVEDLQVYSNLDSYDGGS